MDDEFVMLAEYYLVAAINLLEEYETPGASQKLKELIWRQRKILEAARRHFKSATNHKRRTPDGDIENG